MTTKCNEAAALLPLAIWGCKRHSPPVMTSLSQPLFRFWMGWACLLGVAFSTPQVQGALRPAAETGQWSFSYNSWNQLTDFSEHEVGGGLRQTVSYTYDTARNRTAKPENGRDLQTYTWDHQNRLKEVWTQGQRIASYGYDYRMRRTGKKMTTQKEKR